MIKRILAIARKEVRQIKRDKRMLYVLFIFPFILLVLFGYAINFDVHHIKMFVYDQARSVDSREYVNRLTSSNYFDIEGYINSESEIRGVLDRGEAQVVLVFPREFSENLYSGRRAQIQILVEGVNANTASIVTNYLNLATATFSQNITSKILAEKGGKSNMPLDVEPRFWFNADLDSTRYLIPGLISMILIITAVVSISLSLVREKERGTIEQINVSPLSSTELLIGKTIPYTVISLGIAAIILVAGYFLFGVPVKGNYLLLFLSTFIFLFSALNLGIFVSAISDSQQVAFQISTMVSLLPTFILSGFVFPIESMPPVIQILTNITPAKFFIVILRDILLKGVGLSAFWLQLIYLLLFAVFFLGLAIIVNKRSATS
jgi:drug efflux transport system permease protein